MQHAFLSYFCLRIPNRVMTTTMRKRRKRKRMGRKKNERKRWKMVKFSNCEKLVPCGNHSFLLLYLFYICQQTKLPVVKCLFHSVQLHYLLPKTTYFPISIVQNLINCQQKCQNRPIYICKIKFATFLLNFFRLVSVPPHGQLSDLYVISVMYRWTAKTNLVTIKIISIKFISDNMLKKSV